MGVEFGDVQKEIQVHFAVLFTITMFTTGIGFLFMNLLTRTTSR